MVISPERLQRSAFTRIGRAGSTVSRILGSCRKGGFSSDNIVPGIREPLSPVLCDEKGKGKDT